MAPNLRSFPLNEVIIVVFSIDVVGIIIGLCWMFRLIRITVPRSLFFAG